ncbi:MAG: M20/M25/M40 family metallo-hydrolase [Candidatus Zixiibacteriota bacterium]
MTALTDFKTRFMLAENRRDIALWIAGKFREFGYETVLIDSLENTVEYPFQSGQMNTTWQYNIIAVLEGTTSPDSIGVLGAHYDCMIMGPETEPYTFSPGANNNASGVAAILEIARILRQHAFDADITLHFAAFGSEEFMTMFAEGPSGSEHYVTEMKKAGKQFAFMIDNNQISYRPSTDDWRVDFQVCPGSDELTALAHKMAGEHTRLVPVDTTDHTPYSDVYYFWSNGVPSIFFEEFHFNPYTFTAQDTPENCDMAYCAEIARLTMAIILGRHRQ